MKKIKLLSFLIIITFIQCKERVDLNNYEDFLSYFFKKELNHQIKKDNSIYIWLPITNVCSTCLENLKVSLVKSSNSTHGIDKNLIISAFSNKDIDFFLNKKLKDNYKIIYDNKMKINNQNKLANNEIHFFYFKENSLEYNFVLDYSNKFKNLHKIFNELSSIN